MACDLFNKTEEIPYLFAQSVCMLATGEWSIPLEILSRASDDLLDKFSVIFPDLAKANDFICDKVDSMLKNIPCLTHSALLAYEDTRQIFSNDHYPKPYLDCLLGPLLVPIVAVSGLYDGFS